MQFFTRRFFDRFTLPRNVSPSDGLKLSCVWTVKEMDPRSGLYVPVLQKKNVFTDYGLSQLASAISGGYTPPGYLVIDTTGAALTASYAAGATSVSLTSRVDLAGDTQIVLGINTANTEAVTFSSVSGPDVSGYYTYTLSSPTTKGHTSGDPCVRQVLHTDTMASVKSELQYDATNAPNARMGSAAGYSQGAGNWIIQFYLTGIQALGNLWTVGLSENAVVGQGHLHNHLILGYAHNLGPSNTPAPDVEIDGNLTISNA